MQKLREWKYLREEKEWHVKKAKGQRSQGNRGWCRLISQVGREFEGKDDCQLFPLLEVVK